MRTGDELRRMLQRIDGRGYKAYKDLQGVYAFPFYRLSIDHVQGDPFAAPSRVSLEIAREESGFPPELATGSAAAVASADFISRMFAAISSRIAKGRRGSGGGGRIEIDAGGQQILERNSVLMTPQQLEVRFTMGLPAAGRRVLGRQAEQMFFQELPRIAERSLRYENLPRDELRRHVETFEDQQALRRQLDQHALAAFVGNGSILPRRSGVDDRPLAVDQVVAFGSPPEFQRQLERPHHGPIEGMAIPRGVHLIVGGGFHGKSTLLRALERGVYDHIPGDGREWVVADATACKIRAEDGRSIASVDISPFINNLPLKRDTRRFVTENASGSTSQAANIVEALELGARLLLIDEDTSAGNFMVRDARMQRLIAKSKEPITPLVDRVRELYQHQGVSTILVTGGSGDYFDVADRVIQMENYRAIEVTQQVQEVIRDRPSGRATEVDEPFHRVSNRVISPTGIDPRRGRRAVKIDVRGSHKILFGRTEIDLSLVEQLVDRSQTRAIGLAIHQLATKYFAPGRTLREALELLEADLEQEGLDLLSPFKVGNLARPRRHEIGAAVNRLRTLQADLDSGRD